MDVKPVLKQRCFACHGTLKQEADLRLDTVSMMRDNEILGKESTPSCELRSEHDVRMPPEGEPLKAHEITAITKWIAEGAVGPEDEQPPAAPNPTGHSRPLLAHGVSGGDINLIDAYFDARYKRQGWFLNPRLSERFYYVALSGLNGPPTDIGAVSLDRKIATGDTKLLIARNMESGGHGTDGCLAMAVIGMAW